MYAGERGEQKTLDISDIKQNRRRYVVIIQKMRLVCVSHTRQGEFKMRFSNFFGKISHGLSLLILNVGFC